MIGSTIWAPVDMIVEPLKVCGMGWGGQSQWQLTRTLSSFMRLYWTSGCSVQVLAVQGEAVLLTSLQNHDPYTCSYIIFCRFLSPEFCMNGTTSSGLGI